MACDTCHTHTQTSKNEQNWSNKNNLIRSTPDLTQESKECIGTGTHSGYKHVDSTQPKRRTTQTTCEDRTHQLGPKHIQMPNKLRILEQSVPYSDFEHETKTQNMNKRYQTTDQI